VFCSVCVISSDTHKEERKDLALADFGIFGIWHVSGARFRILLHGFIFYINFCFKTNSTQNDY